MEGGRPEIHAERLGLVHEVDSLITVGFQSTLLFIIDTEGDVVWRPCYLVSVEFVSSLYVFILMIFRLVMSVTIDGIHGDRTILN